MNNTPGMSTGALQKQEDNMRNEDPENPLKPYKEPRINAHWIEHGAGPALERGAKAEVFKPAQVQGQWVETKLGIEGRTCEVIVRILRKIHDPNALKAFEKDLALVAVGAENLDWLKKEYRL